MISLSIIQLCQLDPVQVGAEATFLPCIREALYSNLVLETDYLG
jgi:hypothetical protein